MSRREFLQLAKKFRPGKDSPAGMWVSEKLDGCRVFWDGGISRGLPTFEVPWANVINPKTGMPKDKVKPYSTGLWSRYGNPIMAPDWWLNRLPSMFLDGELYAGRGSFQTLRSIVSRDEPEEDRWRDVVFAAFGSPSISKVFQSGEIKNTQFHLHLHEQRIKNFMQERRELGLLEDFTVLEGYVTFEDEINLLQNALVGGETCYLHQHTILPDNKSEAERQLERLLDVVMNSGGEGVMLRKPNSIWVPKRSSNLLKLKPFNDDQAKIVGFVSGRETDKGSKLRGLIGAVVTDYNGKKLELSGFTDSEREFATEYMREFAYNNPGVMMPTNFQGKHFKVGDTIEFRYRELSDEGIPKEARYSRKA
jgi:DNA ligase-1